MRIATKASGLVNRRRVLGASVVLASTIAMLFLVALTGSPENGQSGSANDPAGQPRQRGSERKEEGANIYSVDLRTKRLRQLTSDQGEGALEPAWWPGRRVIFTTLECDGCSAKLYEVRGTRLEELRVRGVEHTFQPAWGPSGRDIAVVVLGRGIYAVEPRGGRPIRLTTGISDEAPAWSPRGDLIAFDRPLKGTNYELFAVHARTRELRRLTRNARPQTNPSWSPDGSQIAFAEMQPNGNWAIFRMRRDGSRRARVTDDRTSAQQPAWSPDGRRLAYIEHRLDRAVVAVVSIDGRADTTRLTDESLIASKPTWSPDGGSIAFSARTGP